MRTLINLAMTICILIVIAIGTLAIIDMMHEEKPTEQEFVSVTMGGPAEQSAVLDDPESVYSKMYQLQMEKVARNKELIRWEKELKQQKEDYIRQRENWVRYIDGEVITGYDPRYDKALEINDIYYEVG